MSENESDSIENQNRFDAHNQVKFDSQSFDVGSSLSQDNDKFERV